MEIAQKITEYEQEIKRLQLKIELLKECDDSKPIAELFNAQPAQVPKKEKELVKEAPEHVISSKKVGKVVTEEIWLGGEGTGKPNSYYGK